MKRDPNYTKNQRRFFGMKSYYNPNKESSTSSKMNLTHAQKMDRYIAPS